MTPRATVAMVVHGGLAVTRACLDSLRATTEPFVLAVVDNGSPDDTPRFFREFPYPFPLRYTRNEGNDSVLAAYNQAWRLADTEFVCLLHNDTELLEPTWLARLLAPHAEPAVGLSGLYGVKRVRRDGRYAGRTIVHSLADGPTVRPPHEEVAVDYDGEPLEIGFNYTYLTGTLKMIPTESVRVTLKAPEIAATMEPLGEFDGPELFYLVMPLRLLDK